MEASEKSKYKFADALKRLMAHTPLDKITVKEIVEECGLTRQTFYRNFLDKYDLVNWYSVSYTHLDVYKRQLCIWNVPGEMGRTECG